MPVELQPIVESDLAAVTRLERLGFAADPVMQAIFPTGDSESVVAHYASQHKNDLETDPTVQLWKVVDTDTNESIAFAEWHVQPERTTEELDTVGIELPEEANIELGTKLISQGIQARHRIMGGRPYVYLAVLVTSALHRRRGAGSMLIKWGTNLADEQQLPCYVEASPAGAGLYRKYGFEEVDKLELDLRPWVDYGRYNLCMVRPVPARPV